MGVFDVEFFSHGSNLFLQNHVLQPRLLLHLKNGVAKFGLDLVTITWNWRIEYQINPISKRNSLPTHVVPFLNFSSHEGTSGRASD